MIILILFALLSCSGRVWNISAINLIMFIIGISLCVSLAFYCKFGTILALIWVLVYLGGIIVCFVYVLFINFNTVGNPQRNEGFTRLYGVVVFIFFIVIYGKIFLFRIGELHKLQLVIWGGRIVVSNEIYSQIISQSPIFFIVSAIILLYGLIQVLSMLNLKNKTRSFHLL